MNNPFINYAQRSYQQMKSAIISKLQNPVNGIPEITDYSEGNDFIKQVGIWTGLIEQIGYYLNNKSREKFILTARKYESMIKHAKAHDYRVHGVNASSGTVTFTLSAVATQAVNIPSGTILKTAQGIEFRTIEAAVINIGETEVDVDVKQWTLVDTYTWGQSSGALNQEIILTGNVVDKSISVTVAGNQVYTSIDTFAFSKPEDQHFQSSINEDKLMVIKFGDDVTGKIPQSSADIELSYYTSLGSDGNTPSNTIVEIISSISVQTGAQLTVTNELQTNGGADIESLEDLRINIPISIRTKSRAVTEQDFIDIAKLAPGVANSTVSYNKSTGVATVYIVPTGGGIASSVLLSQVVDFFEDKRILQVNIASQSVGEVRLLLESIINVKSGYSQIDTLNLVKQNLLSFLSWENADIKGKLVLGDLYEIQENTEGVLNSQIIFTSIIPYATPQDSNSISLNWTIEVLESESEIQEYKIQFVDQTHFNLFKNNDFINSYETGVEIEFTDIKFTVNNDLYQLNDSYIFKTYPQPDLNKGVIKLEENSIIISNTEDITLTGVGGIL